MLAPISGVAYHDHIPVARHLRQARFEIVERNQLRSFDVPLGPLFGLAHVDQEGALGLELGRSPTVGLSFMLGTSMVLGTGFVPAYCGACGGARRHV